MTGNMIACSCPDFVYHGWNLNPERVFSKVLLASKVEISPGDNPGEYRVRTTDLGGSLDTYHVVVNTDNTDPITKICKHCIRVLWDLGIPVFLVEYKVDPGEFPGRERWEIRVERFWSDENAVKLIVGDGVVVAVSPIERSTPVVRQETFFSL